MFGNSSSDKRNQREARTASPALFRDVRSRLDFSNNVSPLLPRKHLYSPQSLTSSRIGDYHMSRQHPAILDHLYFKQDVPLRREHIYKTPFNKPVELNLPMSNNFKDNSIALTRTGKRHSRVMASLVKHALTNNNMNKLAAGSPASIVQLAAKSVRSRSKTPPTITGHSPVFVKLSAPPSTKMKSKSLDKDNVPPVIDPCDKNVVVSALKQKRKRWWTSTYNEDDIPFPSPSDNNLPSKKQRITSEIQRDDIKNLPSPVYPGKKRGLIRDSLESISKKPKNNKMRIILPDIEIDTSPVTTPTVETEPVVVETVAEVIVTTTTDAEADKGDVVSGSNQPHHREREGESREAKRTRLKREATLKLETEFAQVFPSLSRDSSITRKKMPILCASGSKPLMVTYPLSDKITEEDIKRDDEMATARVRDLLTSDDPEDSTKKKQTSNQVVTPTIEQPLLIDSKEITSTVEVRLPQVPTLPPAAVTSTNVFFPPVNTTTNNIVVTSKVHVEIPSVTTTKPTAQTNVTSLLSNPIPATFSSQSTVSTGTGLSLGFNAPTSQISTGMGPSTGTGLSLSGTRMGPTGTGLNLSGTGMGPSTGTSTGTGTGLSLSGTGMGPSAGTGLNLSGTGMGPTIGTGPTGLSLNKTGMGPSAGTGLSLNKTGMGPSAGTGLSLNKTGMGPSAGTRLSLSGTGMGPSAGTGLSLSGTGMGPSAGTGLSLSGTGMRPSTGTGLSLSGTGMGPSTGTGLSLSGTGMGPSAGTGLSLSGTSANPGLKPVLNLGNQTLLNQNQNVTSNIFQLDIGASTVQASAGQSGFSLRNNCLFNNQTTSQSSLATGIQTQQKSLIQFGGIGSQSQTSGIQFGSQSQTSGIQFGSQPQTSGIQFGSQSQSSGIQFGSQSQSSGIQFGSQSQSSGIQFGSQPQTSGIQFGSQPQTSGIQFGSQPQTSGIQFRSQPQTSGIQFGSQSQTSGMQIGNTFQFGSATGSQKQFQFNIGSQQQPLIPAANNNTNLAAPNSGQTGFQFNIRPQQQPIIPAANNNTNLAAPNSGQTGFQFNIRPQQQPIIPAANNINTNLTVPNSGQAGFQFKIGSQQQNQNFNFQQQSNAGGLFQTSNTQFNQMAAPGPDQTFNNNPMFNFGSVMQTPTQSPFNFSAPINGSTIPAAVNQQQGAVSNFPTMATSLQQSQSSGRINFPSLSMPQSITGGASAIPPPQLNTFTATPNQSNLLQSGFNFMATPTGNQTTPSMQRNIATARRRGRKK